MTMPYGEELPAQMREENQEDFEERPDRDVKPSGISPGVNEGENFPEGGTLPPA